MEIQKINPHNYLNHIPPKKKEVDFKGFLRLPKVINRDKFIEKPVVRKSATGFLSSINSYFKEYTENINHTYKHKIIFAAIEKELYGKNSIDSITHDLDKLIMYILGFPKETVSRVHRAHSEHHVESGKSLNLRSVVCDNIASSPYFKPEKKYGVRDYFEKSSELQRVEGLRDKFVELNFGENLNVKEIKEKSLDKSYGFKGALHTSLKSIIILLSIL